jgi:integrase/recombinase XerD
VIFSVETWQQMQQLRGEADLNAPVFASRKGGALGRSQIGRIVAKAAERAGIAEAVSPHWLRHAHASHALERGTPIALV